MHDLDYVLRIADPIHGLIGVTDIEREVIDSPAFQRLRHIKQLGNVHLLFPGAVHTRFAHSIGVMHTASLLYSAMLRDFINKNANDNYLAAARNVHQTIRLAGLLHDIGHGPLSHHFEECLRKYDEKASKFFKVLFSEWSGDLKISDPWIIESARKAFIGHELGHEHFSLGLIQKLGTDLNFDAQGVCSLLSKDIGVFGPLPEISCSLINPLLYTGSSVGK